MEERNAKRRVADEKAMLKLTADLTDELASIPIPDTEQDLINVAKKDSKDNMFKFVSTEFKTPTKEFAGLHLTCQWCPEMVFKSTELLKHVQIYHTEELKKARSRS